MLYNTLLFLHIASVLWFIGGHGVSIAVGFLLPRETNLERIGAYLDLSRRVNVLTTGPGTVLIIATGWTLADQGDWWGTGWVWVSLVLLIVVALLAIGTVGPHYRRLRRLAARDSASGQVSTELQRLLKKQGPAMVGYAAFGAVLFILAMMVYKPF